ncbi:beta-trefoil [Backusella circina FSU 941]|nr:beta-trefoil [Backusella circina FSU 941]
MTCYHASIAQKSYGLEKRFLCPPPFVTVSSEARHNFLVSMAVVCETAERQFEQRIILDDKMEGYLKHLYVTGTAKAKELHLRINLSQQMKSSLHASSPFTTFYSSPVTIISKPSKKSARIRNSSTCLFKNSLISLFNRINSQTVRTKYLSTESDKLCAKHSSWTPFEVVVVKQPNHATNLNQHTVMTPITYGSQIMLKDVHTGFLSPLVTVCKIEKGKLDSASFGLVIQMQKVALKLTSSEEPLFLSANGPVIQDDDTENSNMNHNVNTWLKFVKSNNSEALGADLCWTIVGVSKQTHLWNQTGHQISPPPSPPKTIIPFPIMPSVS